MALIGVALAEEFVKATILTGRVKNSDVGPLSALLISTPESGKTSMMTNAECKNVLLFTDITGRGIQEAIRTGPEVTHFVILDMVAIMSHRQSVNNYTIAILNAMTEEGVKTVAFPGMVEKFGHGKRGLIACLTRDMLKDGRSWWNKTGFITRMLPFCFDHSPQLTVKIIQGITDGRGQAHGALPNHPFEVPEKSLPVFIPVKPARDIEHMSQIKAVQFKEKGYRRLKQLRSLAQGHALLKKRTRITADDIDFLQKVQPYISFDEAHQI